MKNPAPLISKYFGFLFPCLLTFHQLVSTFVTGNCQRFRRGHSAAGERMAGRKKSPGSSHHKGSQLADNMKDWPAADTRVASSYKLSG